jgi:hypothetical protein
MSHLHGLFVQMDNGSAPHLVSKGPAAEAGRPPSSASARSGAGHAIVREETGLVDILRRARYWVTKP